MTTLSMQGHIIFSMSFTQSLFSHIWNVFILVMFWNDILNIHVTLSSIMVLDGWKFAMKKDVILLIIMSNALLIYDYKFFHLRFEIYDYS
jgi:hypothetical protein